MVAEEDGCPPPAPVATDRPWPTVYDGPRPSQVRFATIRQRTWSRLALMAIHPDLLEILACPVCKTPVELVRDGAGLKCAQCKRVYPVRDDIPIMLPEEATIEE